MLPTILVLLGSLILVFIASLLFVNALEWLGSRLKLGHSFVGAILSPIFTSLPELIVVLIAIFSNITEVGQEIGIGTIFGQPFMASSLSYALVGIAVVAGYFAKKRASTTLVVEKDLVIPYSLVIVMFPLTLIPGLIHLVWLKYLFAFVFLAIFLFYVGVMYRRRLAEEIKEAEELTLARCASKSPSRQTMVLAVQLAVALGLLYVGSRYLVSTVATISGAINISPLGLAIMVIPAATAIPETITAIVWGYRGKDTLSIGSLVGEKILFSTFYPALGLFLTSWIVDNHAISSVVATTVVSLILLYFIRRQRLPWYGLFFGLIFFVAYAVLIFLYRF